MSDVVLLDAGPLGMYAHAGGSPKNASCKQRVDLLLANGKIVTVPGIADYEVRRKLMHLSLKEPGSKMIPRLDAVIRLLGRISVGDQTLQLASQIWGLCRHHGVVTSHPHALDGDVILVAHALIEKGNGHQVEIATTNAGDLTMLLNCVSPNQHFPAVLKWDDLK